MLLVAKKEASLKLLLIVDATAIVVLDRKILILGSCPRSVAVIVDAAPITDITLNQHHNSG